MTTSSKTIKPTSPEHRGLIQSNTIKSANRILVRKLTKPINESGGRNNTGRITVDHGWGDVKDSTNW